MTSRRGRGSGRGRRAALLALICLAVGASGCGDAGEGDANGVSSPDGSVTGAEQPDDEDASNAEGPEPDASAGAGTTRVTGTVLRVSDVVADEPEPEPDGEVWFLPTSQDGFDGAEPADEDAVARLGVTDGDYAGEVPTGVWRPCVRQGERRVFCSDGTVDVAGDELRIDLELGDGYIGFDVS